MENPAYVVVVTITAKWYVGLMTSGYPEHVPWHHGYRFHEDICDKTRHYFSKLIIHPWQ